MRSLVEDYPQGWPQLAAFQNSKDDLRICRRFGLLHCRLLLMLQAEITELEAKLLKLDKEDAENESATNNRLRTIEFQQGWDRTKRELSQELIMKLQTYGKCSL